MQTRLIITFLFTLSCVTHTQAAAPQPLTQPNIPQKTRDACWQLANDISDIARSRTDNPTEREMKLWDKLSQKNGEGEYIIADPKCKEIIISSLKRHSIGAIRLACELAHLSTQTCEDTLQRYNMLHTLQKQNITNEMYFAYSDRLEYIFPTLTTLFGSMMPFSTMLFASIIFVQLINAVFGEGAGIAPETIILILPHVAYKYLTKLNINISKNFWKDKGNMEDFLNLFVEKVNEEYSKLHGINLCSNALKSQS